MAALQVQRVAGAGIEPGAAGFRNGGDLAANGLLAMKDDRWAAGAQCCQRQAGMAAAIQHSFAVCGRMLRLGRCDHGPEPAGAGVSRGAFSAIQSDGSAQTCGDGQRRARMIDAVYDDRRPRRID